MGHSTAPVERPACPPLICAGYSLPWLRSKPTPAGSTRAHRLTLVAIVASDPITLPQLEEHLGATADLFRGLTDVEVQRDYVLALLFFKRACDTYAEETAQAHVDLAGVPNADAIIEANPDAYHAMRIPAGSFWVNAIDVDDDVLGEALNDALASIATANPEQLKDVFAYTDFNNRKSLPPANLRDVIKHFAALGSLTRERVPDDMLGAAYEWLIAKFAADAGRAGGEFYTPAPVGRLGAKMLAPAPDARAYDPTCGSAGLVLHLRDEAFELHGDEARAFYIYGQELKPTTWAIARMNMLLHGAGASATIEQGDTLFAPQFLDGGKVRQFDLIIANPPFSSKNWGHEKLKAGGDPFGRILHVPPKRHGEMAFVQHMVASLNEQGRMAVVLPNGALFRGAGEQAVRKSLIDADLVEAVIQLPKDMFYGAGIAACYLVINKAKPASRADQVLFIDASRCFERRDTKNLLSTADIHRILLAFRDDADEEDFSAWIARDEIIARKYNLTVRRYVRGTTDALIVPLADAVSALEDARAERREADEALETLLTQLCRQGDEPGEEETG
jgi:type I restriction enzyme M protein